MHLARRATLARKGAAVVPGTQEPPALRVRLEAAVTRAKEVPATPDRVGPRGAPVQPGRVAAADWAAVPAAAD